MITPIKKEALVLGYGRSGRAAARLLQRRGWEITVADESLPARSGRDRDVHEQEIHWLESAQILPENHFAFAVISPGISSEHPWVQHCHEQGVPIVSEIELGAFFCRGRILAITGSNGKTTLVEYCREAIQEQGWTAVAAGNIGYPLTEAVLEAPAADWYVVEVSSFQLEHVVDFRPQIAVLLNLFPNHLDRHGDMAGYTSAKLRLFRNMRGEDRVVMPQGMTDLLELVSGMPPEIVTFGDAAESDYRVESSRVTSQGTASLTLQESLFDHPVYAVNLAAACAALDGVGVTRRNQQAVLQRFRGRPHRFEDLGLQQGVRWINDSKATNLAATAAALRSCEGAVHLIAGGVLKEKDLNSIKEVLVRKAACVYLIGDAAQRMLDAWSPDVACVSCSTLARAVEAARRRAVPGEIVLLSPGCASFDQFSGYEQRGEGFRVMAKHAQMEEANE